MPADTPADEREMAREALGLLWRLRPDDGERFQTLVEALASAGFWAGDLHRYHWTHIGVGYRAVTGATINDTPKEPTAILAALRAVGGAADA